MVTLQSLYYLLDCVAGFYRRNMETSRGTWEGLHLRRMRVKTHRIVGCSARLSHSACSCSSGWCLTVYGRCCETLCSHTTGHARGWEMMPAWHVVIDSSGPRPRAAATKSTFRPGQWGVERLVWIYRSAPSLSRDLLSFVFAASLFCLGSEME